MRAARDLLTRQEWERRDSNRDPESNSFAWASRRLAVRAGPIGHEFVGVVKDAGVTRVAKGDLVSSPYVFSDGTCLTAATT